MNVNWSIIVAIAMPIITLFIGAWVTHIFENRPNLISYIGFISGHRMEPIEPGQNPIIVNSHSVVLKNTGRSAATNVRIGHYNIPNMSVNVYPDIQYSIKDLPGGGKEILIPTLIRKKEITVNYLYFYPTTWNNVNTHIESDAGKAKVVNVLLQQQVKPWVIKLIWILLTIGCISSLYLIYELINWLVI